MNDFIKNLESSQMTESGMMYSPDVLVFGVGAWLVFNVLYFIAASLERKFWGSDRLSRTNTVILMQVMFISMCLMFLDGERLNTKAVEHFIEATGVLAIVNAVLRFVEKIKIRKGDFSIEVTKESIDTENKPVKRKNKNG